MFNASTGVAHPIGVFDSGVGGLSVLRQLLRILPEEDFVYVADTAWAPYGERSAHDIQQRSLAITRHLLDRHGIKALVIACNTATALAVHTLRSAFPTLPVIGIEPAIKPAVALTLNGQIGVMATRGTIHSDKFQQLVAAWSGPHQVRTVACNGLALAIENALDQRSNPDGETVESLCRRYVQQLGPFVAENAELGIDTLVLGCTHYPFAASLLRDLIGPGVRLIEPGESVARHTARLLSHAGLLRPRSHYHSLERRGTLRLLCTQSPERLEAAARQWLHLPDPHAQLLSDFSASPGQ